MPAVRSDQSFVDCQAWVKARAASDFSMFAPKLEEWVQLSREIARSIDPSRPAYDVLLDQYEKGMTMERLDPIFKQVHICLHLLTIWPSE